MKFPTFLSLFFIFPIGSSAELRLDLDSAVTLALRSHAQLAAARLEVAVAKARLIDAGKLPNPEVEVSLTRSQAGGDDREGNVFAGFSQRFPITDRLRQTRKVREVDVELAIAEVQDAERRFIGAVQREYLRALEAEATISVLTDLKTNAQDYVALAEQRLKEALGSELDLASAKTEALLADQSLRVGEGHFRETLAALRPLLGLDPEAQVRLTDGLSDAVAELRDQVNVGPPAAPDRADVVSALLALQRAEAMLDLAHAERLEDWEVSLGYENERTVDEPFDADRDHFFGVGLRIPLPFRNKGKGRMAEAEVAVAVESVRRTHIAFSGMQADLLPLLEQREEQTREAYAQGAIDFYPVIQLQQQKGKLRQMLLANEGEYALALSTLQTAQGSHPALNPFPTSQ
ncbi:MAG: TolC family protein [Verrucomicrobiota bacterium]